MDELKAWYLNSLKARIEALEEAGSAMAAGDGEMVESLRRIAHSLRGSGGTYGFPAITEAAAGLEEAKPEQVGGSLDKLLAVLRQVRAGAEPGKKRILVVEDDEAMRHILAVKLRAADREILTAENAEQAQIALKQQRPNLLLLDLLLPDADGRNFLLRLRETAEFASLPVVVLTARGGPQTRSECLALGADAFFEKPFDPDAIAAAVADRLERMEPPRAPPLPQPGLHPVPQLPIFLVEDDELVVSLVRHRLSREGFSVRHFADGVDALAGAEKEAFSLAILDVKIPGMDGFELLERLRQIPALDRMPIVMLTSMGREADISRGFDLGADDYILKPFSPVELLARLHRLLKHR